MHTFYLPPGNLDVVVISGPDAVKLLQGQLTCDVAAAPDPGCIRGALCNNKGRVLATFILVRHGTEFHLVMNAGLGAVLTQVLKKFLPFYKCELRELPGAETFSGVRGNAVLTKLGIETLPSASGECAGLNDGWICCVDQSQQQYIVYRGSPAPAPANIDTGTSIEWLIAGMQSGQFPFCTDDVEKYTAQEISLDRNGYISFTKGCYTGQEIVARMHYRGKLKKLLFLIDAKSTELPAQPMEILDGNNAVLGTVMKLLPGQGFVFGLAALPSELETKLPPCVKNRAGLQFGVRVF